MNDLCPSCTGSGKRRDGVTCLRCDGDGQWHPELRPELQLGVIVEGCNLHIGPIIEIDRENDNLVFESIFVPGLKQHCSLIHCGVAVMSCADIVLRKRLWSIGEQKALNLYYSTGEVPDASSM